MLTIPETDIQHYDPLDCAVFWKTKELYGGFSNMAGGYPLQVNDVSIRSSEALYQACRFPHLPEVQEAIFRETSPLYAKKAAYQHIDKSREDWMDIRIAVMEWTLRIKLLCNFQKFGNLLESTYTLPIVEKTVNRPDYWGAELQTNGTLIGSNALGRLLTELKNEYLINAQKMKSVDKPDISNFLILGQQVRPMSIGELPQEDPEQLSLF